MRRAATQVYAAERIGRSQRRGNAAACARELLARCKLSARMSLVCVRTAASSPVAAAAAPAATAAAAEAATSAHCGKLQKRRERGKRSARDEWRELVMRDRLAVCECGWVRVREAGCLALFWRCAAQGGERTASTRQDVLRHRHEQRSSFWSGERRRMRINGII
jgi:hypothetical protein